MNTSEKPRTLISQYRGPLNSMIEFMERVDIGRTLIRGLPGYRKDEAYLDQRGDQFVCITVASWSSDSAIENARNHIARIYKEEGFDQSEMLTRLGILSEKGIFDSLL